jgi:hypothetical protein
LARLVGVRLDLALALFVQEGAFRDDVGADARGVGAEAAADELDGGLKGLAPRYLRRTTVGCIFDLEPPPK